jgi:hypothetical protein
MDLALAEAGADVAIAGRTLGKAAAVLFADEASSNLTGANLPLDGGLTAW